MFCALRSNALRSNALRSNALRSNALGGLLSLVLLSGCAGQAAAPAALVPSPPPATAAQSALPTMGPAPQLRGQALVDALRQGGYIIYLRHTATDMSQGDSDDLRLLNCNKQRKLSEKGRADAKAIGAAFQALKIPISQVLSSKFCRALDTAHLAFGDKVTPTADITGINVVPPLAERRRRNAALHALITTPPPPGSNLVLVSHADNIRDITGVEPQPGQALVFTPHGPAGFALVAKIAAGEWQDIVKQAK